MVQAGAHVAVPDLLSSVVVDLGLMPLFASMTGMRVVCVCVRAITLVCICVSVCVCVCVPLLLDGCYLACARGFSLGTTTWHLAPDIF